MLGNGTLVSIDQITINFDGESAILEFDPNDLTQDVTVGVANGVTDRTYIVEWVETGPDTDVYYVKITGVLESYPKGIAGFRRFTTLIDTEPDIADREGAVAVDLLAQPGLVFDL